MVSFKFFYLFIHFLNILPNYTMQVLPHVLSCFYFKIPGSCFLACWAFFVYEGHFRKTFIANTCFVDWITIYVKEFDVCINKNFIYVIFVFHYVPSTLFDFCPSTISILPYVLLQPLRWRCVKCVIHHERDVREEEHHTYMWCEQAITVWSWHVNSIVACCHSAKLCAYAARDFQSQQYLVLFTLGQIPSYILQ